MKIFTLKKVSAMLIISALCAAALLICRSSAEKSSGGGIVLSNDYSIEAYLNIKGLDVVLESRQNIKIPGEFTGIFKKYSELQKAQQLPLEENRGKEAVRFLYRVKGKNNIYAELLLSEDNRLIAAALLDYSTGAVLPVS